METTTKVNKELSDIVVKYDALFHDLQILDEAIISYLINGRELVSLRKFFDVRFEKVISALRGIEMGVTELIEREADRG